MSWRTGRERVRAASHAITCRTFSSLLGLPRLPHFGAWAVSHPPLPRFRNAPRIMTLWLCCSLCGNIALTPRFRAVVPASVPSAGEDKWMVIVDRASLLLIQALSALYKVQEQSWRLLELHSIKIVSSGIIWVSLQEVGIPGASLPLWGCVTCTLLWLHCFYCVTMWTYYIFVGFFFPFFPPIKKHLNILENHSLQWYSSVKENCCDHLFNRFLWWTWFSWCYGCLLYRSHGYDLWHLASLLCGPASWWCARCFTSSKSSNPSITPPTARLWVYVVKFAHHVFSLTIVWRLCHSL